ncbi:hypothetical protein [Aminipila sp.]|uniref:hypothetical protein n=1 Tax=Aminipila sp. TaxID=2060095 RepID=UPI001D6AA662|nr:hypothetical protein [Aminipila sp.]MBE6033498.1 hypothetical protein [Clostridiales bacterium]
MTILELEENLNELDISGDLYSLMSGGLPNEKLCIVKEDVWQVYYSERGNKSGLKEFQTESEACEYFLKKMKRYARMIAETKL